MPKPYQRCNRCTALIEEYLPYIINHPTRPAEQLCHSCFVAYQDHQTFMKDSLLEAFADSGIGTVVAPNEPTGGDGNAYNQPNHYHQHEIDTIRFLQEGFSPDVFAGFAIGHIIKYLHRFQYKNGMDDLYKAKDYMNRLWDFAEAKKLGK